MKTVCGSCGGTGQDSNWIEQNHIPVFIITDCKDCGGTGLISFALVDKRKNSKGKKRLFPRCA